MYEYVVKEDVIICYHLQKLRMSSAELKLSNRYLTQFYIMLTTEPRGAMSRCLEAVVGWMMAKKPQLNFSSLEVLPVGV